MTAILALSACGEEELPPIEHVLVVTTPEPGTILLVITVTPGPNGTPDETQDAGEPDRTTPALSPTPDLSPAAASIALLVIPTPGEVDRLWAARHADRLRAVPDHGRGGCVRSQSGLSAADVLIRHNRQIWVMISGGGQFEPGRLVRYLDTFVEGGRARPQPDPARWPYQPRRG